MNLFQFMSTSKAKKAESSRNRTILGAHMNVCEVKPMQKKKGFHIRYHHVEGDLKEVLSELVQEKVLSVIDRHSYNPTIPIYDKPITVGDVNDAKDGNLCKGID